MSLHALRQGGADSRRCWRIHDDAWDERRSSRPNPGAATVTSHMRVCILVVSPQSKEDTRLARELGGGVTGDRLHVCCACVGGAPRTCGGHRGHR